MTPQEPPYRPERQRGATSLAQRLMVAIPLLIPGISLAGLFWLSEKGFIDGWLGIASAVLFVLLAIGCCGYSAWLATVDADREWRRYFWIESAVMAGMMQIVIAPVMAGFLIVFFISVH
jgi:hypothetical protein